MTEGTEESVKSPSPLSWSHRGAQVAARASLPAPYSSSVTVTAAAASFFSAQRKAIASPGW